jgi:hypothetical protein
VVNVKEVGTVRRMGGGGEEGKENKGIEKK